MRSTWRVQAIAAERRWSWVACSLIALLTCGLYLPFLQNPLVFDDKQFFAGQHFAYYATHPIGLMPRLPGYFTLAFTQTLFERIEAHRAISLALHALTACALYGLILELLSGDPSRGPGHRWAMDSRRAAIAALFGASAFALHPVAVYAAGYLVQRSIVVATFFGVVCLALWHRALLRGHAGYTLAAAAAYSMAVLSKEHAAPLALAALPLAIMVGGDRRLRLRQSALLVAACVPAALLTLALTRQLLGAAYEPNVQAIEAQAEAIGPGSPALTWPLSVVTQMGLFFRYLADWFLPMTRNLSIDLRVDYLAAGSQGDAVARVAAFVAVGFVSLAMLFRRDRWRIAGYGLSFVWILYLVEFSAVRFQEPYVLYRSYLWAPGFAIAAATLISVLPLRIALAAVTLACPLLFLQAHDRLATFSSARLLWEDAVAKLPASPVPWGSRVLYNLGREYLYAGAPAKAVTVVERCMKQYPDTFQCVYARGAIHFELEEYGDAIESFERAARIEPRNGGVQYRIAAALERMGRREEAAARYRRARALGFGPASLALDRLARSLDDAGTSTGASRQSPRHPKP